MKARDHFKNGASNLKIMKIKITLITALALLLVSLRSEAQAIPNGGFETWTNFGTYSDPAGWTSYNSYTASSGIFTTEQGTPGATGASYLKLTIKNNPAMGGLTPGIAISMPSLSSPNAGFPVSSRPTDLTGQWQYQSTGIDTLVVQVILTKWNTTTSTSDMVGLGSTFMSAASVTSWTNFSVPILYFNGDTPDSATVYLFAGIVSTPTAGDYLYIDDLAFSGTTASIDELQSEINMTVSPNPFATQTTITFIEEQKNTTLTLMNIAGKTVKSFTFSGNQLTIEKNDLPAGLYFLLINDKKSKIVKKIIIQ